MMQRLLPALILAALFLSRPAPAALVHDEAADGDLSGDGLVPTAIAVAPGANTVAGSVGAGDRDYFTISVPAGVSLGALFVQPGTTVRGAASFIAIQAGAQVTAPPDTPTAAGLLGWYLYGPADIGTDILPLMGAAGNGAAGFAAPLAAGEYAFWVQELGQRSTYRFDLVLTPVPEPSAARLLAVGAALLAGASFVRRGARRD
jgi:hypothetical protein